jgi:hypothetical protein
MALVVIVVSFASVTGMLSFHWPARTRSGDTSLGRKSVNWLAATAIVAALLICLLLV